MKKIFLILSALLFISCGKGSEKETLMFVHYFTGNLSQGIDQLTEAVNMKQRNINLVATPMEHEEFKISIRLQLDSENPPDLFSYWAGAKTEYLVKKNKISPIGRLMESVPMDQYFDRSVLDACSYREELYMLPITRHYVGFFYNRSIFGRLGLDEPRTWEDFLVISGKISNSGVKPYALGSINRWPAQFWFDYILLRTAGYSYREKLMSGEVPYTDDPVVRCLKIWDNLIEKGYFNSNQGDLTWDGAAALVTEGSAAMTLMGTWVIPYFEESGFSSGKDFGFFPFPEMDSTVESVSLGPIDGVLLSANSTKQKAAGEILKILAESDSQLAFNAHSGAIAPQREVDSSIYSDLQLEIIDEISRSPYWAFNYDLATDPLNAEAGLDFFAAFLATPGTWKELSEDLQKRISSTLK